MTAMRMVNRSEPVYKFRDAAHIPKGVTVDGVLEERARIVDRYGRATTKESAEAVMTAPEAFPNLRAFAPKDAETALRLCVEQGVSYAYRSIVEVEIVPAQKGEDREVEVRLLHAVPTRDSEDLSYEPLNLIREEPAQRNYLIQQLRRDACAFARKLEDVLGEIDRLIVV